MGRIGWTEILLVVSVFILLFGPQKLPELGKALGNAIKEFKKAAREFNEDVMRDDKKSP